MRCDMSWAQGSEDVHLPLAAFPRMGDGDIGMIATRVRSLR
jgi:hypothetical protein